VRKPQGPLLSPQAGAQLTSAPLLVWKPVARARFYNVQLYRKGRKIFSAWPTRPRLKLRASWKFQGKTYRMTPGTYTWVVWPAYGKPSKPRYGKMLGQKSFKIVKRRR
jgi:hypothetical protein